MHLRAYTYDTDNAGICIMYPHVCTRDLQASKLANIENGEMCEIDDTGRKRNWEERANIDRSPRTVPHFTETKMNH